ncbi:hypothetical protein HUI95_18480 [Aeromonas dhakensis]|uniref:hypothetical protein n=1 Tax=Aeromonas dhakensis TaxID=196024 RepID=UPI0010085EA8|nr:hypothetical protein [Aeromonas dhakensis]QSR44872.1 hypothetical protein HUI95_18265 [Aeromonas dhakensis]QSR44908.1 hypothetical protein HUI95_18480 [Aeromonas dhakensis]
MKRLIMPMFDIEDSKDVTLEGNKTSRETLARLKNVDKLKAIDNEAGAGTNKPHEDILELKPNCMGFGINLRALWRKYIK